MATHALDEPQTKRCRLFSELIANPVMGNFTLSDPRMLNWARERWEFGGLTTCRTFTDGMALQNNTELDSAINKRPRLSEAIACA